MARKHQQPLIPQSGSKYRPPLEVQRAQIEKARDSFREQGYAAELSIEAFGVQDAGDGELKDKEIEKLEHQRDNCYKSARAMDEKLKRMPIPKAKPKKP